MRHMSKVRGKWVPELESKGVFLMHASHTVLRGKRRGWSVATNANGRIQGPSFISRSKAVRLFQHAANKGWF